jgi:pyruvate-ferredoxin/flavodoxin oxidoreductase
MDRFGEIVGRRYRIYEYAGAPDAERVAVVMGSAAGAIEETVEALRARGEKVGVLRVRLYRPFSAERFVAALPETTRAIAVLDRTKEPGAAGEPLYEDVVTALSERTSRGEAPFAMPLVIGGRYGLASKEFTPAMAAAVFAELERPSPKNHFTVGITDDVSGSSLHVDRSFHPRPTRWYARVFYGPARTARSARTRTRSRSSGRRLRTSRTATSCTTRRRPGPSRSHICGSAPGRSGRAT